MASKPAVYNNQTANTNNAIAPSILHVLKILNHVLKGIILAHLFSIHLYYVHIARKGHILAVCVIVLKIWWCKSRSRFAAVETNHYTFVLLYICHAVHVCT